MTTLENMITAAQEAGALIRRRPVPAPPADFAEFQATFAAVQAPAEALLRKRLAELRPGVRWADEFDADFPAGEPRWVVDVLDGAVQYLHGLPQWCVSLALVEDGVAVATVLHNPLLGETCWAAGDSGAFRDGEPITPSVKTDPAITVVATSQPPFAGKQPVAVAEAGRSLSAVAGQVGAVRNLGPTSWQIADVAAGRLDAFWQYGVDDANLVGPALLAREAGAKVTDADGCDWRAGSASFLVAPEQLHGRFVTLLRG